MTTQPERWLLDTNVWVFGLRRDSSLQTCGQLLDRIGSFCVVIPLQVLKELNVTLTEDEVRDFYRLVNQSSEFVELSWEPASVERVKFYEDHGCRKGDAVIAAHAEELSAAVIVSENRQFLHTLQDWPIKLVTAGDAQIRLAKLLS